MYYKRSKLEMTILYIVMILVALFFLMPFLWILRCSMVSKAQA